MSQEQATTLDQEAHSQQLQVLREQIRATLGDEDRPRFDLVYSFAEELHRGQKRKSGEPFLIHPLEVAKLLVELNLDASSIFAAILHDIVEDTAVSIDEVRSRFGEEIATLVDGVTKISKMTFQSRQESQAENFRKMLLAMSKDLRVILIKLADRLHNMRTLNYMPEKKQVRIANETLEIYCPLVNRLGISWMKLELEDLCLRYLKPDIYFALKEKVSATKKERQDYIGKVLEIIKKEIAQSGLTAKLSGRPKHFYSIYKKMERRNLDFEQIHDVIAFRLLVKNNRECYDALGVLHSIWKPIPGRFKDFIALPKENFYQSLHTTVIGPFGERIEIQIRTEEMHHIAEYGIAAHWKYKERDARSAQRDQTTFNWLRQIVELQGELHDPTEFLQTFKVNLFPDEVYVFTPGGEVKALPKAATPVDFAYAVHSEIGNKCVGAKINGKIVPLKTKLQNGDIIEIITREGQHPNKDWLKFVVTSKAKTKIRQIIRNEQREQSRMIGRESLEKELKKHGLTLNGMERRGQIDSLLQHTRCSTLDELLVSIGYGKFEPRKILQAALPEGEPPTPEEVEEAQAKKKEVKDARSENAQTGSGIKVDGLEGVLIRYGKCCSPVYGDPIEGFITRGRGITIHTTDCPKILQIEPERKIPVEWDETRKIQRLVKIRVHSQDIRGLLAKMSKAIADNGGNITSANIRTTNDQKSVCLFEIGITDTEHLHHLIQGLEKVKGIISVERCKS